MPRLGDLVGTLMAEFTLARVRADLEAVRLVELYGAEGLLQGAPVPRFRLPDITVDMPVLMAELRGADNISSFARPNADVIRNAVVESASATDLHLDTAWEGEIVRRIDAHLADSWRAREPIDRALLLTKNAMHAAEALLHQREREIGVRRFDASTAAREIPSADPRGAADGDGGPEGTASTPARTRAFLRTLALRLNAKVIGASGQGPRLMVAASTGELREVGDASLITRIRMSFNEDGFEVVKVERGDGGSDLRLTPE
ncbi:MAG: hypothetical protein K2Y51_24925 [Gammaproteobacteria bacterium]|jgi:hypothetical protein|nr:hypothetical protein [Gammaproteobacteria bacterium]